MIRMKPWRSFSNGQVLRPKIGFIDNTIIWCVLIPWLIPVVMRPSLELKLIVSLEVVQERISQRS